MSFQLPPEIQMRKELLADNWVYIFRHETLGDLGRIVVQGLNNGETKFDLEISGGSDDLMFQKRKDVFIPLSKKVIKFIETTLGVKSRDTEVKQVGSIEREAVIRKLISCSTCNSPIALLIFCNKGENEGDLENTARLMHNEIEKWNVPTWVIGGLSGQGDPMNNYTIVKKVWSKREALFESNPAEFNKILDDLDLNHCS